MRPTITFSSSNSSESEDDEKIPTIVAKNNYNPQNVNHNLNQNNDSDSYDDYSSEIVVIRTSKQSNILKRPVISPKNTGSPLKNNSKLQKPNVHLDDKFSSEYESSNVMNAYEYQGNDNSIKKSQPKQITTNKSKQINAINKISIEEKCSNSNDSKNKLEDIKESDFDINYEKEITEKNENEREEEELNPPIVKVAHFQPKSWVTYAISRKFKSSIRGKRYYYYFYYNSVLTYCAKAKTRHPESYIHICEGKDPHVKCKSPFTLVIDQESTFFSLRKGDKLEEEMMVLKIISDSALLNLPGHVDVQILSSVGNPQISLTSKSPKMSSRGNWILDFHDKFTIPSEKNMIFVSSKDKNGAELLLIRKISSDGMEIDLCTDIPEIDIFAIGLSIFLAKFR